jgi:hypothetical protein
MLPQSSSSARYAFDGVRAQIRDLHTENNRQPLDRMVAAMN